MYEISSDLASLAGDFVKIGSGFTICVALLRYVFTGHFDASIFGGITRNQDRFDRVIVDSVERNGPAVRKKLEIIFADELSRNNETRETARANADTLEFIKVSVIKQGEMLVENTKMGAAVEQLTAAVREMTENVKNQSESVHKLELTTAVLGEQVRVMKEMSTPRAVRRRRSDP